MKKYVFFILGTILIIILCVVFLLASTVRHILGERMNYVEAKEDTIEFFQEHRDDFLSAVDEVVKNNSAHEVVIEGIGSISLYAETGENTIIKFYKQGYGLMTGGQSWGLYYSANNHAHNQMGDKLTSGPYEGSFYWSEPNNGEDFFATERIEECWFFYYFDFDGNSHELDWNSK